MNRARLVAWAACTLVDGAPIEPPGPTIPGGAVKFCEDAAGALGALRALPASAPYTILCVLCLETGRATLLQKEPRPCAYAAAGAQFFERLLDDALNAHKDVHPDVESRTLWVMPVFPPLSPLPAVLPESHGLALVAFHRDGPAGLDGIRAALRDARAADLRAGKALSDSERDYALRRPLSVRFVLGRKACAACGLANGLANGLAKAKVVKLRKCSKCDRVRYCSPECQAAHWATHKVSCRISFRDGGKPSIAT